MEGCSEYLSASGYQSALTRNSRDRVKKEVSERKRNVLYLISAYLREQNLIAASESLNTEAQLSCDVEVCDNIDLDTILQEYQSYYYAKLGKNPKITRIVKHQQPLRVNNSNHQINKEPPNKKRSSWTVSSAPAKPQPPEETLNEFQFNVRRLLTNVEGVTSSCSVPELVHQNGSLLKPLCDFQGYSNEWREMADVILKEIVPNNLGVNWADCIGLEKSAELLKEAVVYPLKYPELFSGLIAPWKGILLYGPPGTGKTLLSRAVACESKTIFFNVTSSCFVNKWRGESEKMVKVLFDIARFYAPSTIFIDELDALACSHSDYQHDASRRFKSELLTQLDGVLREEDKVFILATTNKPWDLDTAILRRFEKRILVDLPNEKTRMEIYRYYFQQNKHDFTEQDFSGMGIISVDFSGSEIKTACREGCMRKLREGLEKVTKKEVKIGDLKLEMPTMVDVAEAVENIRPVTNSRLQGKYLKWHDEFGCH